MNLYNDKLYENILNGIKKGLKNAFTTDLYTDYITGEDDYQLNNLDEGFSSFSLSSGMGYNFFSIKQWYYKRLLIKKSFNEFVYNFFIRISQINIMNKVLFMFKCRNLRLNKIIKI